MKKRMLVFTILSLILILPSLLAAKTQGNIAILTFDDGPNKTYTPAILDILKKYNVKATFFVMGGLAKHHQAIVKRAYKEGHSIANHTYNHPKLTKISDKRMRKQISKTSNLIEKLTGKRPTCFRPPYGLHNKRIDAYANKLGMKVIMWDVNSFDYNAPPSKAIIREVFKQLRPGVNNIMFHDGPKYRKNTVKALPVIIEGLKKRGYRIEPFCQQ